MPDNRGSPMFDFKFIKDRYDFELARKEQITNALTMPIGVMSVIGALLVAMGRSFNFRDSPLWWTFVPLFVADVMAFVICLIYLGRAYHLQTYIYLPLLSDLDQAADEFRDFNAYVRANGGDVEETFEGDLLKRIIDAADRNTKTNERRTELLRIARLWLFSALWLTLFAGFPYVADQVLKTT